MIIIRLRRSSKERSRWKNWCWRRSSLSWRGKCRYRIRNSWRSR